MFDQLVAFGFASEMEMYKFQIMRAFPFIKTDPLSLAEVKYGLYCFKSTFSIEYTNIDGPLYCILFSVFIDVHANVHAQQNAK